VRYAADVMVNGCRGPVSTGAGGIRKSRRFDSDEPLANIP
jgi:hypothetical protein